MRDRDEELAIWGFLVLIALGFAYALLFPELAIPQWDTAVTLGFHIFLWLISDWRGYITIFGGSLLLGVFLLFGVYKLLRGIWMLITGQFRESSTDDDYRVRQKLK